MYRIELDEKQLSVVIDALDNYHRMGMGQLDVSVEEFIRQHRPNSDYFVRMVQPKLLEPAMLVAEYAKLLVNELKLVVWGHPPGASYGIYSKRVPQVCREAYDIKQILRKSRWDQRMEAGIDIAATEASMFGHVDSKSYLSANPEQPPVSCEVVKPKQGTPDER